MMINSYYLEEGHLSVNHDKEELCGDHVEVLKPNEESCIIVLADGLGSGVKANILSTLTAQLLGKMVANNIPIEECVRTVASTLPVCKVRKIAYSTFTIISIKQNRYGEIYNFDNPSPFLLHNGKIKSLDFSKETIDGKIINHAKFEVSPYDTFVLMSDGVIHAGIGETLNFGWEEPQIHEYMEALYDKNSSSKALATVLLDRVNNLYGKHPGDDATVCVLRLRERKQVNLLIGPASCKEDDEKMLSLFFSKEGKHIVCGGTTSNMVSRYLNKPLDIELNYQDKSIPPIAYIEGVDLVTEGVITLNKVLDYANNTLKDNQDYFSWCYMQDGASQIARILFEEATNINLYVGCAINPAHQQEGVQLAFSTKMQIVDELTKALRKMGKNVKTSYF